MLGLRAHTSFSCLKALQDSGFVSETSRRWGRSLGRRRPCVKEPGSSKCFPGGGEDTVSTVLCSPRGPACSPGREACLALHCRHLQMYFIYNSFFMKGIVPVCIYKAAWGPDPNVLSLNVTLPG